MRLIVVSVVVVALRCRTMRVARFSVRRQSCKQTCLSSSIFGGLRTLGELWCLCRLKCTTSCSTSCVIFVTVLLVDLTACTFFVIIYVCRAGHRRAEAYGFQFNSDFSFSRWWCGSEFTGISQQFILWVGRLVELSMLMLKRRVH